jgi:hypothetical protein
MEDGIPNSVQIKKIKLILGVCVLVGILIYLFSMSAEEISIAIKDDSIVLSYTSGESFEIKYKNILGVTERQDLDLGKFVSGTQTKKHLFGIWNNNEFGEYHLAVYSNVVKYIVIETSERIFVINFDSKDATDSFYKAFSELLRTKQAYDKPIIVHYRYFTFLSQKAVF